MGELKRHNSGTVSGLPRFTLSTSRSTNSLKNLNVSPSNKHRVDSPSSKSESGAEKENSSTSRFYLNPEPVHSSSSEPDSPRKSPRNRNLVVGRGERSSSLSLVTKRNDQKAFGGYEETVHSEDRTGELLRMKTGYLKKENRRSRWNRRFFATNNSFLNYYKKKASFMSGDRKQLSASIDLRDASAICLLSRNGKSTTKFAIQTQHGSCEECFFLKASTVEDAMEWVDILNERRTYWTKSSLRPFESIEKEREVQKRQPNGWFVNGKHEEKLRRIPSVPASMNKSKADVEDDNNKTKSDRTNTRDRVDTRDVVWWQETSAEDGSISSDEGFVTGEEEEEEDDVDKAVSGSFHRKRRSKGIDCLMKENVERMRTCPDTFDNIYWSEPDVRKLRIRGSNYLENRQKIQATEPMFTLVAIDLYKTKARYDHIASHPSNRMALAMKRGDSLPFVFMVHIQIPGPPFYSFVAYFAAKKTASVDFFQQSCLGEDDSNLSTMAPELRDLASKFFKGEDDELRNDRFKLVPRIAEGPFIVRRGVPSKPALLGRKLKQRYFRGENYLELCCDVGSSIVAWKITQMSVGYAKLLTCDLAIVLQGNRPEELPEIVIGILRANKMDMNAAIELDEEDHGKVESS